MKVIRRLFSLTVVLAILISMVEMPVYVKAAAVDGLYESFSGLSEGTQTFIRNSATGSYEARLGTLRGVAWRQHDITAVDASQLDSRKHGKVLKHSLAGQYQGVGYTADYNTTLEKGDILTISFEYYEDSHTNDHKVTLYLNNTYASNFSLTSKTTYTYQSLMKSDRNDNANQLMRYQGCFYPSNCELGYSIGAQNDGFARYDVVLNTCDAAEGGRQTASYYRNGTLLDKGILYEKDKTEPISKISSICWNIEQVSGSGVMALDNIYIQKTSIAAGKKTGVFAQLDANERHTSYAIGSASSDLDGEKINVQTGNPGDSAIVYRSIANKDGSGTMNVMPIMNDAYFMADIKLGEGENAADYYAVLASKPEADNDGEASASGVQLSKYLKDGKVKIPLSAFNEKHFPNGEADYSRFDAILIAGAGIAFAPADAKTGSIEIGDIYIVGDVQAPTNLHAADMMSGQILLNWTPSENIVAAYELYRDGTLLAELSGGMNSYTDTGLENNTFYTYTLKTKTLYGTYVEDVVLADVYLSVVGKPSSFETENIGGESLSVKLTWGTEEYGTAANYIIYRNGKQIAEVAGDLREYIDDAGLSENETYEYSVCAKAADGSLSYMVSSSVTVAYIYAPGNLQYVESEKKLIWKAVDGTAGYNVYCNGKKIANAANAEYILTESLPYNEIYSFYVTALTAGGKESSPSGLVYAHPFYPAFQRANTYYSEQIKSGMKANLTNVAADLENTENTAIGKNAVKLTFDAAQKGVFTIASTASIGADKLGAAGHIVFAVYVPKNVDLSKIFAGFSYTPTGSNVTPVIAALPLENYIRETGRWTVAEIPVSALPKTATYTQNTQNYTVDVNLSAATGISIVGDFSSKEEGAAIYIDELFDGCYENQTALLTDINGNALSESNKLGTNAEGFYLETAAGFDPASLSSGAIGLKAADGSDILISYGVNAAGKIKVSILSALAPDTAYTLAVGGIQDKNGAAISGSYTFGTNADAAQPKDDITIDMLNVAAEDVTVGMAAKVKISLQDPCISPADMRGLELKVRFDGDKLKISEKNVDAGTKNVQVSVSADTVTIQVNQVSIGTDLFTLAFEARKTGSVEIGVSGGFTAGNAANINMRENRANIKISASTSSTGNGGSGYGGGRGTGTSTENQPVPTDKPQTIPTGTKFTDVAEGHWAYAYIQTLADKKIVNGYSDGSFKPENPVTREEFVVILAAAFGMHADGKSSFSDVAEDAWYAGAIEAARQMGIISGRSDGSFGVGETITREDMCVMVYKAAEIYQLRLKDDYDKIVFTDSADISAYAFAAIETLQKSGIISGYETGSFEPKGHVTRAAAARVVASILPLAGTGQTAAQPTEKPVEDSNAPTPDVNAAEPVSDALYNQAKGRLVAFGIDAPAVGKVTAAAFFKALAAAFGNDIALDDAIDWASAMGILKDEAYNANTEITYGAALTAAVRALGFQQMVEYYGGGMDAVYRVASSERVTNGIKVGLDDTLTGQTACVLLSNILSTEITEYNVSTEGFSVQHSEQTVMEKYLTIESKKVQVLDIDRKKSAVTVLENNQERTYIAVAGFDFDLIAPTTCTIYINGDDEICYCEISGDVEIFYDYIQAVNGSEDKEAAYYLDYVTKLTFKNRDKYSRVAPDVNIYYNEKKLDNSEAVVLVDCFARVIVSDNSIVYADIYKLDAGGLIYTLSDDFIKFTRDSVNENTLRGLQDIGDLTVVLDGTKIGGLELLNEKMVFDFWKDADETNMLIAASSRKAYGKLQSYNKDDDRLSVGGEDYLPSDTINFYNAYLKRYQQGEGYEKCLGEYVNIYLDDRSEVRYVIPDSEITENRVVYGVVLWAGEKDDDPDVSAVRFIPVSGPGSGNERVMYDVSKKLRDGSLSVAYAASVAKNLDGKGFLKFTINQKDEIIKIEFVENFGRSVPLNTPNYTMTQENYYFSGLFLKYASILVLHEDEGGFGVTVTDYERLRKMWLTDRNSDIQLTTDYDPLECPLPRFAVLTGRVDKIYEYDEIVSQFVNRVEQTEEGYDVTIGAKTYHMSEEFVNNNNIKQGAMISARIFPFTPDKISISSNLDMNVPLDEWKTVLESQYGKYSGDKSNGIFCADKVLLRSSEYMQFEIDGKPTDVLGLGYIFSVIEIDQRGRTISSREAPVDIANKQWFQVKQALENIEIGDRVWFSINTNNGYRCISRVYYCKN